jgi:sugar lactone lactonase YvrE
MKLFALALLCLSALTMPAQTLSRVAKFASTGNEYPESITRDVQGNLYLPLVFDQTLKKVSPNGRSTDFATIPDDFLLGTTMSPDGQSILVVGATGIWRVNRSSAAVTKFSDVSGQGTLNDLVYDAAGNLFVSDDTLNRIWKIDTRGRATAWSDDALFQVPNPDNYPFEVGCNGLAFSPNYKTLYVTNTSEGIIIQIPILANGRAGKGKVLVRSTDLIGIDGLKVAANGDLYVAQNITPRILRVTPQGEVCTVVAGGALAFPTALVAGANPREYFICNNGDAFFSETPRGQGVLKLTLR